MGSTSNFHPVGLMVIRGGAQYAGFTLGRVTQILCSPEKGRATYRTQIKAFPQRLPLDPDSIKTALNAPFSKDVTVQKVWLTKSGQWFAQILTQLNPDVETRSDFKHAEQVAEGGAR